MTFPTGPNVGDTFLSDDTVWTFNGISWDRTKIGVNNSTRYSNSLASNALLDRISTLEALLDKVLILE